MESTRKTVKDSSFFFFFVFVRSTAAEGSGQQSTAAVTRADVALTSLGADVSVTSLGLTWQQRRNARRGAWHRWSARGSVWARGWRARNFWRGVGERAGLDPTDFGGNG